MLLTGDLLVQYSRSWWWTKVSLMSGCRTGWCYSCWELQWLQKTTHKQTNKQQQKNKSIIQLGMLAVSVICISLPSNYSGSKLHHHFKQWDLHTYIHFYVNSLQALMKCFQDMWHCWKCTIIYLETFILIYLCITLFICNFYHCYLHINVPPHFPLL